MRGATQYANICLHALSWIKQTHKLSHLVIFLTEMQSVVPFSTPLSHEYHWQYSELALPKEYGLLYIHSLCSDRELRLFTSSRHSQAIYGLLAAG